MAAADRGRARPEADRARQPVPRPARPLRRARAPRRRVGARWSPARRAERLRAQRRRPADRRPRPRSRAAPPRRASPTSGSRTPSQALPELQHAFDAKHCRRCGHPYAYERAFVGHLGHYACPNCGADRPTPDVAATAIELLGMRGSRSRIAHPGGRGRARAAAPRPLQRLQRARRARRPPCASGSASTARSRRWLHGRGRLRARRDDRGRAARRRLDPADQEPGRAPTRSCAPCGSRPPRDAPASTSGSRSTTGSPTAATSPGSGTRTSSCSPASARPRRLLRHAGAGDGACGSSTRASIPAALVVEPSIERSSTAPSPRPQVRSVRAAHLHGADRAAHAARRARAREGVLAVTERPRPRRRSGTTSSAGRYAADLAIWARARPRGGRPGARARRGTGRVALHLAGAGVEVVAARPLARAAGRASRGERRGGRARGRDGAARMRASSTLGRALRRRAGADAARAPARRPADARPAAGRGRRAHLRPGGTFAAALLAEDAARGRGDPGAGCSRTCASSTAGSTRACRSRSPRSAGGFEVRRLRQLVSPGGRAHRGAPTRSGSPSSTPAQLEAEAASAGLAAARANRDRADGRPRRLGRLRPGGDRDEAAPAGALSRSR